MKPVFSLSVSLLGALLSTSAIAIQELDTITVSASRLDPGSAGSPFYVIEREQIEKSTARNVSELLAAIPGISVRLTNGGVGNEGTIDLRGFGAAASVNTLVLVDGRRLNDVDLASTDIGGVPLAMIERIEVQPGGGSVLYGDGASGGTINIITRQAQKSGGSVNLAAGSFATREATASGQLVSEKVALGLFGQHQETDGYRDNSTIRRDNIGANLRFKFSEQEIYLLTQGSKLDSGLPGTRLVDASLGIDQLHNDPRGTDSPSDYADEERYQTVLGWQTRINDKLTLVVDGGQRHKQQKSFFDFGGGYTVYTNTALDTLSLTPRLRLDYTTGALTHALQTGFDWYRTDYTSLRGEREDSAPVHNIGIDSDTRSPYIFQTSQWHKTTVSLGARQSRVKQENRDIYNASAPGGAFDSQAAPQAQTYKKSMYEGGVSQVLLPGLSTMISASRSVRFGTVDEVYEYDASFQRTFSPLRPQTGHNIEGSLVYQREKNRVTATVYRQKLRDEIQFNPATFTNDNLDPTLRRGATLALSSEIISTVTLNASLTHQRALFREGPQAGNSVPVVPERLGYAGINWQMSPQWELALSDTYTGSKYFDNDAGNNFGQKIPACHRLDTRAGFRKQHFNAGFSVHNLTNEKDLYDYGVRSATPGRYTTYPLPGREYRFDVGLSF